MLKAKVLKGTAIMFAARMAGQLLGLASTMALARLLVPEDFGLVAIATSIFFIFSTVLDMPVGTALIQMKEVQKSDYDTAWTLNLLRGVIVAALMLAVAWPASLIFEDPRLFGLIAALAAYPILLSLRNSNFERFVRELTFHPEAWVDFATKVSALVVGVTVAWFTRSYWALPIGMMASCLTSIALTYILRPELPSLSLKGFRKFISFSIWLTFSNILDNLWTTLTTLFMGRMLGPAIVGAYSVGAQLGERLDGVLVAPAERALFSGFSSIQDQPERLRHAFLQSLRLTAAVILPVCAGISLLAEPIVAVLFGANFKAAVLPVMFIAPITALGSLSAFGTTLAIATGATRKVFNVRLIAFLIFLPLITAGLLLGGLEGALWALLVSNGVYFLISFQMVSRLVHMPIYRLAGALGRSALACALMVIALLPLRGLIDASGGGASLLLILESALVAALGALLYISAHVASWYITGRPEGIERFLLSQLGKRRPGKPLSETPAY